MGGVADERVEGKRPVDLLDVLEVVADVGHHHVLAVEADERRAAELYNGPGNSDSQTPECRVDYTDEKVLHFRL